MTKINMEQNNQSNKIYEVEGVFGDENEFEYSTDRFNKISKILKNLAQPPQNILDVGCGTGFFSNTLRGIFPNANLFGVDISKKALEIGREKYKSVSLIESDAEVHLPFENDYFDLVICGENIEHIRDVDTYLEEISRVMKKGGALVITTPNLTSWINRILVLFGKWPFYIEPSLKKTIPIFSINGLDFPDPKRPPVGHLRLFTVEALYKLLYLYSLKITKAQGASYLGKPFIKPFDKFFSNFPTLATGLVVLAHKI